ncbi:glycosyltransferase [Pseudomonas kuykendallii]|uniref:glycosyltransferase n=1 Tax=Pseudomonas kuykendallii TaxID=1007099 RepID=UPI002356A29E|nr:glycosyltransferase family 2 protein [Pseudomonas kuykendallii]
MTVRLFTCIVSHGHADFLISALPNFLSAKNLYLCVVDNIGQSSLRDFCSAHGIAYIAQEVKLGFGANNNRAFRYFEKNFHFREADYFICCNPDVWILPGMLEALSSSLDLHKPQIAGINLFVDEQYQFFDSSIRRFPRLGDYLKKALFSYDGTALDKSTITTPVVCDWAAGSFLVFSVQLFKALEGFDEHYFMYFEDVDICLRAWRARGQRVLYIPNVRAVHFAAFRNRAFFSKHFRWYVSSLVRYLWRFYFHGLRPAKDTSSPL